MYENRCIIALNFCYFEDIIFLFLLMLYLNLDVCVHCSGDQDAAISYVDSLEWINQLELSTDTHWNPWFVNGQVAGLVFRNEKPFLSNVLSYIFVL